MPVQINNDEDTLEVSAAEYKAVIDFSARIAEQNRLILDGLKSLRDVIATLAEQQTATSAGMVEAIKAIKIAVNVPEQSAPVVNVEQPDRPARKVTAAVRRDRDGNITGIDLLEE